MIKQPRLQFESGKDDVTTLRQLYDLQLELRVLSDARIRAHDNIVKLQTIIWKEHSDDLGRYWPSLVIEYANLGTMADFYARSQRPSSHQAELKLCYDIGDALHFLNDQGIVYRDIKPDNILMSTGDSETTVIPKIGDFGYSLLDGQPLEAAGTEEWKAPEILASESSSTSSFSLNISNDSANAFSAAFC